MKKKFDYKWVIMIVCFLTIFCSLGFASGPKSLYTNSITKFLNIKRSLFSINDSIRYVMTAIISLFFAPISKKLGIKRMVGIGFLLLVASCLTYAYATELWHFYIGGFLIGSGFALCSTTAIGYIITRWFTTNRGTVTGFCLAGNGLGTAFISQFIEPMIDSAPDGYKTAYKFTALLLFAVGIVIMIFLREAPKNSEAPAEPFKKKKPRTATWVGITFDDAKKMPYFYVMLVCMFFTGAVLQAISGVSFPHIKDVVLLHNDPAFDTSFIATTVSIHAIALTAAKFLSGFSSDKLGIRTTAFIIHFISGVAILMLAAVTPGSYTLAFIYEIIISFAMPLETVIALMIVSELFGEKDYAKLIGINTAVMTFGYAVGTPILNYVYDKFGTYRPGLYVESGVMFAVMIVMQFVFRKGRKVKNAVLAEAAAKE
ncbi:MAG: MFS transporter [Clostridia bacterium]|nr:MFS transporter [Clostridia bacterium]